MDRWIDVLPIVRQTRADAGVYAGANADARAASTGPTAAARTKETHANAGVFFVSCVDT